MENIKLNDEMHMNNDLIAKLKKQSDDQDDEIARLVTQLVTIENEQELEDYYEDNGFIMCEDCNKWLKPEPENLFIITNNSTIREIERTICSDCFSTWWESYKLDGWKCAKDV